MVYNIIIVPIPVKVVEKLKFLWNSFVDLVYSNNIYLCIVT